MTRIEYQLRIRNAANSADVVVITSVRGGTNPYLADEPTGDGTSFDPISGASMMGSYTGTIADWPIGSSQRVLTSQLEDATAFTQQLGYRRCFLEFQINGGGFAGNVLIAGVLTLLRLTSAATWEYTITDPMRQQVFTELFSPTATTNIMSFLTTWPNRGCALGGPIMTPPVAGKPGSILGIQDLGGWQMKVESTALTGQYFLRPVKVYGPPHWIADDKIENVADIINQALLEFQNTFNSGSLDPWTTIQDTQTNYWAWNGVTVLIDDGSSVTPWKPLTYGQNITTADDGSVAVNAVLVGTDKGSVGLHVQSDGTRTLTNGALVRVRVLTVLPTEVCPIYITANPIDVLIALWTSAGIAYDATACAALKADVSIGSDAYIALRITESKNLAELVEAICAPFGIGLRGNNNGEISPFQGRVVGNTPPTTTIGPADVIDGSTTLPFELDPAQAVKTVVFQQKRFTSQRSSPFGTKNSIVDGVIVSDDTLTLVNGDASAIPFGEADITIDGMVHSASATYPTVVKWATQMAQSIFYRAGHGLVALETTFVRGGNGDTALLGTEVLVNLPQLPNHNYRLGDNGAIAARAMQVVRRTVMAKGYAVRLLDSGPNAQPLATVPTLSIAASSDAPRTVATVTITNAATLNALGYGARLQWATTTGGVPASSQYTDVQAWGPGLIPTTAVRLSALLAGATVYVQARSEGVPTARPSNYGTAAHVTLSTVSDPSSVTATPSGTDGSLCVLAWTPGSGTTADFVDVWLRLSTQPFSSATRQVTLNPGSNTYKLENLIAGTAYLATVQYRDPRTGDLSDPIDVSFTAGGTTRTLAAPVDQTPFAGSIDPFTGQPTRDGVYGIAVLAAEYPGTVEFAEAVETSVGSGTFGTFTTVGRTASVSANWTTFSKIAPNDGLNRQLKARHIQDGATSSAYTAVVTVLPWTPLALLPFSSVGGSIIVEVTFLTPTAPGAKIKFSVTGIDPAGGTPQVKLVALGVGTSISSGPAVGVASTNGQIWEINDPPPGSGAGSVTVAGFVGTNSTSQTITIPEATVVAQGQGTVAVDANGNWEATADAGSSATGFRYLTSTSAFPADATVISSGITASGRTFSVTGGPLAFGQTIFVTIVPNTATALLPSIHIRGAYLSMTATKTLNFSSGSLVESNNPSLGSSRDANSNLLCGSNATHVFQFFTSILMLPVGTAGVLLTAIAVDLLYNSTLGGPSAVDYGFYRKTGSGGRTALATGSASTIGWQTLTASLSENTAGNSYLLQVDFDVGTVAAAAGAGNFALTYTMSDPKQAA